MVQRGGLENRGPKGPREFESHPLRSMGHFAIILANSPLFSIISEVLTLLISISTLSRSLKIVLK